MATIFFFNYCINTPLKGFTCLQNKFFKHFILLLLNSSPKQTNIWMRSYIYFVFENTLHSIIKGVIKLCLITVLTVFLWTFNSFVWFLIDVVRSFLITIVRELKNLLFIFSSILHSSFSLKSSFSVNKFSKIKKIWLDFGFTGWNDKIVILEKTTWFHFRLMKTGFLLLLKTIY